MCMSVCEILIIFVRIMFFKNNLLYRFDDLRYDQDTEQYEGTILPILQVKFYIVYLTHTFLLILKQKAVYAEELT